MRMTNNTWKQGRVSCAFTVHRPHKFPWKDNEADPRCAALKLRCILPHEGQADRWNDSARERYHTILQRADSVEYVSRPYYDGCMIDRNHRLVESAVPRRAYPLQ